MADIVALNKVDLCTQAEIKNAYNFLDALYPAKQEVIEITQAALPIERLIGEHDSNRKASFPSFHSEASARSSTNPLTSRLSPLPIASISGFLNPTKGKPYISFYDDGTVFGVSAIYHPEDILNLDSVNALLDEYKDSLRCKAVIRQTQTSALFNITQGEKEQASSAWRRDSRIEILQYTPFDQNALRHQFNVILSTS
jgi:G3E family GTPase